MLSIFLLIARLLVLLEFEFLLTVNFLRTFQGRQKDDSSGRLTIFSTDRIQGKDTIAGLPSANHIAEDAREPRPNADDPPVVLYFTIHSSPPVKAP
jgi:hypothetical protein